MCVVGWLASLQHYVGYVVLQLLLLPEAFLCDASRLYAVYSVRDVLDFHIT